MICCVPGSVLAAVGTEMQNLFSVGRGFAQEWTRTIQCALGVMGAWGGRVLNFLLLGGGHWCHMSKFSAQGEGTASEGEGETQGPRPGVGTGRMGGSPGGAGVQAGPGRRSRVQRS